MTKQGFALLLGLPFSYRQLRLRRKRKPVGEAEFVESVRVGGGDEIAAALLWNVLQAWICVEGFTPSPSDNLERIYGIAEEERDEDLILAILRKLQIQPPDDETLDAFGQIDTALRLAQLVARCRRSD